MIKNISLIIAIIITILIVMEYYKYSIYDDFLTGFWKASKSFCEKSGIQSAQMYFMCDNAYLMVIDSRNAVIINKVVKFKKSPAYFDNILCNVIEYKIHFEESLSDMAPEYGEFIPQNVSMKISHKNGLLGIYAKKENETVETLYLELYKDNMSTLGVF